MAPEAAIDQAFRRVEEIFTKCPIRQSGQHDPEPCRVGLLG